MRERVHTDNDGNEKGHLQDVVGLAVLIIVITAAAFFRFFVFNNQ